jgi:hypothetical protein
MSDSQNEESKGFFYKFDLTNPLEGVIQEYENERERFWASKGPDYQIEYDRAERFAQFVFKGTESLVNAENIEEDLANLQYETEKKNIAIQEFNEESRKIVKPGKTPSKEEIEKIKELAVHYLFDEFPEDPRNENSPLRSVWERFCIKLSWKAMEKIKEGANRIFNLYNLVLSSPPSRPTLDYLSRLSRCYIWGFDPECVILCRSILDSAFRKKILDNICEDNQFDYDLKMGIDTAIEKGLINDKTGKLAHSVRIRGNKAIHNQPDATKDVWGTIRDTITVLEVLFGR